MQGMLESMINTLEQGGTIDDIDEFIDDVLAKGSFKSMSDGEKDIVRNLLKSRVKKNALSGTDVKIVRKLRDETNDKSKQTIDRVNAYQFPLTREGFLLEFAIANASVAGNNDWNKLQSAKTSIWLTPSYRFNVNKDPEVIDFIDLMAVLRVTINAKNVDSTSYADFGGKLQWVHNKLSVSGEGVFRYLTNKPLNQKKNYTVRTAFTLSYKLNDLVTFKATFGSNFDGNSTHYSDPSKMFAVGGFHFGFSNFLKGDKRTSSE
jgi:Arc/MetJ-type ribon-helix-helix transcriptional regulator